MKCSHCGKEVPEGELFCSCGHPVTINENSADPSQMDSPLVTSIGSTKTKKGMPKFVQTLIVVAVFLLIGFGYVYYKNTYSLTNEKSYHEVSTSEFSMTIPKTLEKSSTTGSVSDGMVPVAFYTSEKAAVDIEKIPYSQNPALESMDMDAYLEYLSATDSDMKPTKDGDVVYVTYIDDGGSAALKNSKDCYVVEALFQGDDAMYSVNAYCYNEDKDKYEESLIKWVKSFKLK